jgi:hypothetical protein
MEPVLPKSLRNWLRRGAAIVATVSAIVATGSAIWAAIYSYPSFSAQQDRWNTEDSPQIVIASVRGAFEPGHVFKNDEEPPALAAFEFRNTGSEAANNVAVKIISFGLLPEPHHSLLKPEIYKIPRLGGRNDGRGVT